MLKRMINNARIEMEISPIDPLLIKSGQATVGGVDMSFVRTYRFGEKEEPYIPGSSLKGVIRSYSEKICRSLRENPVPVCLPYVAPGKESAVERRQASCGLRIEEYKRKFKKDSISSSEMYKLSCPICRLFGSHCFVGRCATADAYLTEAFKKSGGAALEIRDGVAIDRFTGGAVKGAKYDLEVLTRGDFSTSIEIRNFERWQLGLLGLVLRDMEEGLVHIGFGKSRGLGRIKVNITKFLITSYHNPLEQFSGIAAASGSEICEAYGFFPEISGTGLPLPDPVQKGLRLEYDVTRHWKETEKTFFKPALDDLIQMIESSTWPEPMEQFCQGRK